MVSERESVSSCYDGLWKFLEGIQASSILDQSIFFIFIFIFVYCLAKFSIGYMLFPLNCSLGILVVLL